MNTLLRTAVAILTLTRLTASHVQAFVTFPFVTIADVGNPNDTASVDGLYYGGVTNTYQISTTDVTNAQYTEFLNLIDPTGANALALYNPNMDTHATSGGIHFSAGAPDGSKYTVKAGFDSKPVTYVSFFDAMRFVNWLSNGQSSGDTESGAYTLSLGGLAPRNAGSIFFLPSENEWYKAAYYDPTKEEANNYYLYGTHSDTLPTASAPTTTPNSANYASIVGGVTDVGAYSSSASHYGLFDMAGNVWNWNDTVTDDVARGLRAGSWAETGTPNVGSVNRFSNTPSAEAPNYGFRVATVPEPASTVLLLFGAIVILRSRSPQHKKREEKEEGQL